MSPSTRLFVASALLSSTLGGPSRAGYVVDVTESGGDIVATGSGTINTAGIGLGLVALVARTRRHEAKGA